MYNVFDIIKPKVIEAIIWGNQMDSLTYSINTNGITLISTTCTENNRDVSLGFQEQIF